MDCRRADRIVHEPSVYYVWKPSRATNEIPWSVVVLRPLCNLPHLPGVLRLAFQRGILVRLPPGKPPGGIPTEIRLGGRKLRRRWQAQNQSQRVHRQFPARVHVHLLRGNPGFRGVHERETQVLRRSIMGMMKDWNQEKRRISWSTNPSRGRTIEDSSYSYAQELNQSAVRFLEIGQYVRAISFYMKTLHLWKEHGVHDETADSRNEACSCPMCRPNI